MERSFLLFGTDLGRLLLDTWLDTKRVFNSYLYFGLSFTFFFFFFTLQPMQTL